jgi:hypothetical protein
MLQYAGVVYQLLSVGSGQLLTSDRLLAQTLVSVAREHNGIPLCELSLV